MLCCCWLWLLIEALIILLRRYSISASASVHARLKLAMANGLHFPFSSCCIRSLAVVNCNPSPSLPVLCSLFAIWRPNEPRSIGEEEEEEEEEEEAISLCSFSRSFARSLAAQFSFPRRLNRELSFLLARSFPSVKEPRSIREEDGLFSDCAPVSGPCISPLFVILLDCLQC